MLSSSNAACLSFFCFRAFLPGSYSSVLYAPSSTSESQWEIAWVASLWAGAPWGPIWCFTVFRHNTGLKGQRDGFLYTKAAMREHLVKKKRTHLLILGFYDHISKNTRTCKAWFGLSLIRWKKERGNLRISKGTLVALTYWIAGNPCWKQCKLGRKDTGIAVLQLQKCRMADSLFKTFKKAILKIQRLEWHWYKYIYNSHNKSLNTNFLKLEDKLNSSLSS